MLIDNRDECFVILIRNSRTPTQVDIAGYK